MRKILRTFRDKPYLFFFYLFLLSIPLQARLVFLSGEGFNEYTNYFLYLSDLILITTLICWFVKSHYQSIGVGLDPHTHKMGSGGRLLYSRARISKQEDVSRETRQQPSETRLQPGETPNKKPFVICNLLFVILLIWSFLSLIWAQNLGVGFFRAVKLAEFAFLFLFIIYNIKTQKHLFWVFLCITAAGFFQAIIGIWQYFIQHSIGLKWLGETILSPNISGVAKIVVNGQKIMRAYGTFPHPNVFAGFLLLSITCGLLVLFRKKKIWLQSFLSFIVSLQAIALILTFSRVAWVGAILLYCYIVILLYCRRKSVEKRIRLAILAIILVILVSAAVFWPQISSRFTLEGQALEERGLYNNIALSMIKKSPILGVGMGNFVPKIDEFSPIGLQSWQYQPAHNIYLLILAELGIVGFVLFVFLVMSEFRNSDTRINADSSPAKVFAKQKFRRAGADKRGLSLRHLLLVIFIGFLFIGFFDHYFWTLQQGGLMFWLVLGILGSQKLYEKNN